MMRGLAGKRVIVTGGTSGIGEATCRRFIEEGAQVVAFGYGEEETMEASSRTPGLLKAIRMDVADQEQVASAFAEADEIFARSGGSSGLDVLVSNAGISVRRPFLEIDAAQWQRVLAVNLHGMFYCSQEAAKRMESTGGVILMTASANGLEGHPNYADYNASKAGVILLAKTMALELAPRIRVNCVCPGYVLTPMQEREYTPEMIEGVNSQIPLKRHAEPREVAALFAFLASEEASYITGAAIPIDGGETAGRSQS
jgi:meso-butanediol dehydrogenase / (S,S)-butanediol dehydrogenase / diacetyl reductase